LRSLYLANEWDWPFTPDDSPVRPEEYQTPAFTYDQIAQLITSRDLYTHNECFYLALATIYGLRRVELARIKRESIKGNTIYVDTAKKGEKRTHLIPEEILPYIKAYKPREHHVSPVSATFHRIVAKAKLGVGNGYGWHSFRRSLDTLLPIACAKNEMPLTFVAYFLRWSRRSWGRKMVGATMAGVYSRPEIISDDPFYIDRQIFSIHPFLPLWRESGGS